MGIINVEFFHFHAFPFDHGVQHITVTSVQLDKGLVMTKHENNKDFGCRTMLPETTSSLGIESKGVVDFLPDVAGVT